MYAHFYQLSENPFNLTPDPKFHYVNESTREAMASLLHGIKSRKGFIALIAEAGTGKTTLLKRIVDEIEGETQIVFVFNPGVSFDELLEFICSELGIETRGCKRLHLLDRLNSHLLEQLTAGRNVVVMIDEAQTLEDSVLEELRLLSNLETSKEKILQILLSGQPELDDKLRKPSLRQLRQRIGVRATLRPVQMNEMQAYVETRLRSAGAERGDLFTPAALTRIWQASGGIPRVINVICDNAMMIAFADGQQRITPKTLKEALRDVQGDGSHPDLGTRAREWVQSRTVGYVLAAAAVAAAAIPLASVVLRGLDLASRDVPAQVLSREAVAEPLDPGAAGSATEPASMPRTARAADPVDAVDPDGHAGEAGDDPLAFSEAEDLATRQALESNPTKRQAIADSIRRAEIVARSTAARLYPTDDAVNREGAPPKDLTDAALDEVARDGGLTGLDVAAAVDAAGGAHAALQPATPTPAENTVPDRVAPEPDKVVKVDPDAPTVAPAAAPAVIVPVPEPVEPKTRAPIAAAAVAKKSDAPTPTAGPTTAKKDAVKTDEKREVVADARPAPVADAPPLAAVRPPATLGRLVQVEDGDTVWDLAIRYYGGAGPATLKRILTSNPTISDPLKLEVGTSVFLPFSRPDQMISRQGDSYRVLLAAAPSREGIAGLEGWARSIGGDVRIGIVTFGSGRQLYELYVVGLPSEPAALDFATGLLERTALVNPPQRTAMR